MPLKQTPLHTLHVELGAKMVDFAGWSMPLHYGSQIEEHHAVRRGAGMFDVSHMLALDVTGIDGRDFLRRVLANDVAKLERPGKALYTCMLRGDAGILDDLIVYWRGGGDYRVVVNAGTADKDVAWLELQRGSANVNIVPRRDLALIAVQGPRARDAFWAARPRMRDQSEKLEPFAAVEIGSTFVARTGYTGEDGFEIMTPAAEAEALWRDLAADAVNPTGLGARDTLRLEAGMNLYGQDMDEQITPYECGLAWTVHRGGGRDFIGREALERRTPRTNFLGLVLLDRGVMRAHQRVHTAHGEGVITSGGFSPTMNRSIGLARLPPDVARGVHVEVEVRERRLKAMLVKPPFVRHGKVLIDSAGTDA